MNIDEPDSVASAKGEMTGMDHASECEDGSRDHEPVCSEETVGCEPSLEGG